MLCIDSWNVRGPADFHSSHSVYLLGICRQRDISYLSDYRMKGGSSFSYHFKLNPFEKHTTSYPRFGWLGVICQFEYVIKW